MDSDGSSKRGTNVTFYMATNVVQCIRLSKRDIGVVHENDSHRNERLEIAPFQLEEN